MKKTLLFLGILLLPLWNFAQGETDNWYFGDHAGLHFDNTSATALNDGALNTQEGSASISDSAGNLLFYTDGITVYNKNHEVMENGTGLFGGRFSTQPALIIQQPDKPYIYYLFTLSYKPLNFPPPVISIDKLFYSVIDMRLDDGNGAVTIKNTELLAGVTEKLTAVNHQDNTKVWLMTHDAVGDGFNAILIDTNTINTNPITTNIGMEYYTWFYYGQLKFSHNGKKLVNVNGSFIRPGRELTHDTPPITAVRQNIELFKFNNTTGELSEMIRNEMSYPYFSTLYGVEFSKDDKKLFVSKSRTGIFKFDITIHTDLGLTLSKQLLAHPSSPFMLPYSSLQLARNNKIYISSYDESPPPPPQFCSQVSGLNEDCTCCRLNTTTHLSTIENNVYHRDSTPLEDGISREGLPNFNQSLFTDRILVKDYCDTFETQFSIASFDTVTAVSWNFGDGATSNQINPSHSYNGIGTYQVTAIATINGVAVPLNKTVTIYELPTVQSTTLVQCDDDSDGFSIFNLTEANNNISDTLNGEVFRYYETENDATIGNFENNIDNYLSYQNQIANEDTIYVRIENQRGCFKVIPLLLKISNSALSHFMRTYYACDDIDSGSNTDGIGTFDFSQASTEIRNALPSGSYTITYYNNLLDAQTELNEITENTAFVNTESPFSQDIYVRIESQLSNDCVGLGHYVTLEILGSNPEIQMEENYILCENSSINIAADQGYNYYLWSTGETTQTISVNTTGDYTITLGNSNGAILCSSSKTIHVLPSQAAQIDLVDSSEWSLENNTIYVYVSGNGNYEYSIDGSNYQDENWFENLEAKNYTIYVNDKNGCGVAVEDINLLLYPRFFTPNDDGYNDTWQIYNDMGIHFVSLKIFDRYGKLLKTLDPNYQGWDGKFNDTELPASDYWFTLEDEDGKVYRGHFALKR